MRGDLHISFLFMRKSLRGMHESTWMNTKVLVVGIALNTFGGHTRFVTGLLHSRLPYKFVHFNSARPPKKRSSSRKPGYQELYDAGIIRAGLGAAITIFHLLKFPIVLLIERPKVVHIAGGTFWPFWENAIYVFTCKLFGIRTIYHWLGNFNKFYVSSGRRSRSLVSRVLQQVDRHIVLSELDEGRMRYLVPRERTHLLPSAVSSSLIRQLAIRGQNSQQDDIRALFIGGRDPVRKGVLDVLKAFAIVARAKQDIKLVLTGGDNLVYALEQATDPIIEDRISFLGYVSESEKIELYGSADMLLLPSYDEGLPYVVLETMAAGLPIITTPIGGIPDVVNDTVNGFLIDPGDYRALAQRILVLCQDGELRKKIGNDNREKVAAHYSEDVVFSKLELIYEELCADAR